MSFFFFMRKSKIDFSSSIHIQGNDPNFMLFGNLYHHDMPNNITACRATEVIFEPFRTGVGEFPPS